MRRHTFLMTVLFGLLSLLAYGEQVRDHDATWVAPSEEASKANPLATRTETAAGGRKLFHQHCATCHGENGRGTKNAPDLGQRAVQEQSDGALFWKISSGDSRQGMPTFSFLPALQRWQLVLHVRAAAASRD